jgi:hypothetical protein
MAYILRLYNLKCSITLFTLSVSVILLSVVPNVLLHRPTFQTGRDLHEKATILCLTPTPKTVPIVLF